MRPFCEIPPKEHAPGNAVPQLPENPLYRPSSSIFHTLSQRRVLLLKSATESSKKICRL